MMAALSGSTATLVWCSVLQDVAVWCSVLHRAAVFCVAVCCSVVANAHDDTCLAPPQHWLQCDAWCHRVLQCVAVCCSVLQYVAVCCGVLQGVTECCSVLQCPTVVKAHDNIVWLHSNTSITVSSENATSPKSAISRNPHFSVQIQIKRKSHFGFVPRGTEKSEFLDLVDLRK